MANYRLARTQVKFILDAVDKHQDAILKKIYNIDKMKSLIEPDMYDEIMQLHQSDLHFISDIRLDLFTPVAEK